MNRLAAAALALGGFLLWHGLKGGDWGGVTGGPAIPRWFYVASGVVLVVGGIGLLAAEQWMIKARTE